MRILIIALARSGGYQLNEWLALELGYKMIHEPIRTNESIEGDNIVVKYLINEIEDIKDIDLNNWDKIIGLTRTDIRECAISQTRASQRKEWRNGYEVSDEWIIENEIYIKQFEEVIYSRNKLINGIKEIHLQVTYESIYNTKEDIQRIKDYIGIRNTRYEHLLDKTNRLRNRNKAKRKLI
jgi:hypothetical protein